MSFNDIGNKYLLTILLICSNKHEDVNMTKTRRMDLNRRGRVVACMVVTCVNRYGKSVIDGISVILGRRRRSNKTREKKKSH